jgi:hypothetical protein
LTGPKPKRRPAMFANGASRYTRLGDADEVARI